MKRALTAVAVLTAMSGAASAGVYGGLSVGPTASVQDDEFDLRSPGRAVRLLGGYQLGRFAGEVTIMGNTLRDQSNEDVDNRQIGLVGKYNYPLGSNFEVFGRAGVQYTSLSLTQGAYKFSGAGLLFGPGVEYKLKFVAASASIRLDYTISYANVDADNYPVQDGLSFTSGQWMLGFTVGI